MTAEMTLGLNLNAELKELQEPKELKRLRELRELFPSSPRRGVRDINKLSRSLLYGADGVVSKFRQNLMVFTHHPVCAAKDAAQLFLIAQTPLLGEEGKGAYLLVVLGQHLQ